MYIIIGVLFAVMAVYYLIMALEIAKNKKDKNAGNQQNNQAQTGENQSENQEKVNNRKDETK